jgi:hypothetical protein
MEYQMSALVGFLNAVIKKREQDLEASLAEERMNRKAMSAVQAGMERMFGQIGDYAARSRRDAIANTVMNEEFAPSAAAVDPAMNERMRQMGYGGPTKPAQGGVAELDLRAWMAGEAPEVAPGTIVRHPQTGELAVWDGKRWEPYPGQ